MGVLAAPPDILRYHVIKVKHLPFHPLTARIHIRIEYDGYTVRRVYTNSSGKGAGDLARGKYVNRYVPIGAERKPTDPCILTREEIVQVVHAVRKCGSSL